MAVTFPPNPNVGDTVTDSVTGATWVWNGTAWVPQGVGSGVSYLPLTGGAITGKLSVLGPSAITSLPAAANPGSFLSQFNLAGQNFGIAAYYDGTNWRQLPGTGTTAGSRNLGPALIGSNNDSVALYWNPPAADNTVFTPTNLAVFSPQGSGLSSSLAVLGVLAVNNPSGNSSDIGLAINTGTREWVLNAALATGNFYIMDVTGGGISRLTLDLLGNATVCSLSGVQDCSVGILCPGVQQWNLITQGTGGNGNFLFFNQTNSIIAGWITRADGTLHWNYDMYAPAFTQTSDPRLKDITGDYTSGLDALKQLSPITYRHNGKGGLGKDDASVTRVGLNAATVRSAAPNMVKTWRGKIEPEDRDQTDIAAIDLTAVVMTLINAVKELAAKVEALEGAA